MMQYFYGQKEYLKIEAILELWHPNNVQLMQQGFCSGDKGRYVTFVKHKSDHTPLAEGFIAEVDQKGEDGK